MKKVYILEDLSCANCAAKMEVAIGKINGVNSVFINFATAKMTLEADDLLFGDILKKAAKIIRKIEPNCRIIL